MPGTPSIHLETQRWDLLLWAEVQALGILLLRDFHVVLKKTLRVGAHKVPLPKVPGLIMDYWINEWAFLRYLPQN